MQLQAVYGSIGSLIGSYVSLLIIARTATIKASIINTLRSVFLLAFMLLACLGLGRCVGQNANYSTDSRYN